MTEDAITKGLRALFLMIGEDPDREGLRETPARWLRAWGEWAQGYSEDPIAVLKTFEHSPANEMVIVSNIPVVSTCEHHLAAIVGIAHVGYVPQGRIVGLSKLARVVDIFARRLQVQERLTDQIADCVAQGLNALGVGVIVRARHHCMITRGVKAHQSLTTTSAMRGAMFDIPSARAEFINLCRDAERDLNI